MALMPTDFEQLQLELINLFRTDPGGEFARLVEEGVGVSPDIESALVHFGVDLDALADQLAALSTAQPLAWNRELADAADFHSGIMIQRDRQTHQAEGEPDLRARTVDAGYTDQSYLGENVFAFTVDPLQGHAGFVIDWGYDGGDDLSGDFAATGDGIQDPPGHRNTLINNLFTEIGIGAVAESDPATDVGPYVVTQNLGGPLDYAPQFVGVIVDDIDNDGFYDMGEGVAGVTVTLVNRSGGSTLTTTSWESGGWQIAAPAGTYDITFSGGGLETAMTATATIADENVKVDAYNTGPRAPEAEDDSFAGKEDGTIALDLLANDSDVNRGTLQVESFTQPAHGEVREEAGGLVYLPQADFFGTDSFTYTVVDEDGLTDTATVTLIIAGVDDAPIAVDDEFTVQEDGAAVLDLIANDGDVDGDALVIDEASLSGAAHGTVVLNADGTVTYTPAENFAGTDKFTYRLLGAAADAGAATVALTVTEVNDPPVLDFQLSATLKENAAAGTLVGHVEVADDAAGTTLTLEGPDAENFYIDEAGDLRVGPGALLDYENARVVEFTLVGVDSGQLTATLPVSIDLVDVFDEAVTDADDVLEGTENADDIDGGAGDDVVRPGLGNDRIDVGEGNDVVAGSLTDLSGDVIVAFGRGDRIRIEGESLNRGQMAADETGVLFDADGDGTADEAVSFQGFEATNGDFMLTRAGGDTELTYVDFLPGLLESVRVDADGINGIAAPVALTGANSSAFQVSIESSMAGFANSLGIYEIDADGNIANVRVLSANVKSDIGAVFDIVGVDVESSLGFFLVQDGANVLGAQTLESDSLGITTAGGAVQLTDDGAVLEGATIFVSHDAALNKDGAEHMLSGISDDGSGSLRIGFEDLERSGAASDDDFQDLVIGVLAVDAGPASADAAMIGAADPIIL